MIILGAGGHSAVVIEIARACGFEPVAIYDDSAGTLGKTVAGVRVKGRIFDLPADLQGNACIAIGNNQVRKNIACHLASLTFPTLIHPSACVSQMAHIDSGAVVCAGALIQPNATIGRQAIVNIGACIDHDSRIGDFAHVGARACAGVSCRLGEGAHAGIGAIIRPFAQVEPWASIAPGAVI